MNGAEIKSVRLANKMTQNEAADRLGVSQGYLSMLELGCRSVSVTMAARIAKTFVLPPTALPLGLYVRRTRSAAWFKEQRIPHGTRFDRTCTQDIDVIDLRPTPALACSLNWHAEEVNSIGST